MDNVHLDFNIHLKATKDPVAAAVLVLADAINKVAEKFAASPVGEHDSLAHEICMGIRKGLFGAEAHDDSGLHNGLQVRIEADS